MEPLIGRRNECQELERAMHSARSEFVVLYGRRRVGKTFLIRHYFQDSYDFHFVGVHNMKTPLQLRSFRKALEKYSGQSLTSDFQSWMDAFEQLEAYLESLPGERRKVIFIDEMPWIDNKHSDFVTALEYFWNSWVAGRDDIVLIACGSATSWMADKLQANRGGLHNRITRLIYLRTFNLHECREYITQRGFDWDPVEIIRCYMYFGGVPFYWSLLEPHLSLVQNIENLCFKRDGLLANEYDELYHALFGEAASYQAIVRLLSEKASGMTREELVEASHISGGTLTRILKNLERCDFISVYSQFGKKSRQSLYRLCDFYTLFYFKFLEANRSYDGHFWTHHFNDPSIAVWQGLTFELLCLVHLPQIQKALGIAGIATQASAWKYIPPEDADAKMPSKGTQIDLLIWRADKVIHICEMKFSDGLFSITKDYEQHLRERMDIFRQVTGTHCSLIHTFMTPRGLVRGAHTSLVHSEIVAEDLFADV